MRKFTMLLSSLLCASALAVGANAATSYTCPTISADTIAKIVASANSGNTCLNYQGKVVSLPAGTCANAFLSNLTSSLNNSTSTSTATKPSTVITTKPSTSTTTKPSTVTTTKPSTSTTTKPATGTSSNSGSSTTTSSVSAYEAEVVRLVNVERAKNGLSALTLNSKLSDVARAKSQDMRDKGYFSHTSPTYGSPFDMMKTFGITYKTAGENIAMGYATPEAVVTGWMNSPGHRANILKSSFTQIGVGYVASGNYWTQMFIG